MKVGVLACDIMKRELDGILREIPQITEVIYLEAALHCYPTKMKEIIKERMMFLKDKVDVLFLGYGYCGSLKGIEDEFDIPVVMPQMDGCIQILMTPQKYEAQIRREAGTWFMTAGWAEIGTEMIIKENHLERVSKYGRDPLEMAKRLFAHYRSGLYIDTGVENNEHFLVKAAEFCRLFNLTLEKTEGTTEVLKERLGVALKIAGQTEANELTPNRQGDSSISMRRVTRIVGAC